MSHFLAQTFFGNYIISPVYKAFDSPSSMSGTKVMTQKPHFTLKSENCRKCIESATSAISIFYTSPLEHASELFEPSKDLWSLVICTEKKILRFGFGVFSGCRYIKGRFCFFVCSIMTSSPGKRARIVAQSLVVFQAGIWSCRGLDRLPSVSGAQVKARRPQIIEDMAE